MACTIIDMVCLAMDKTDISGASRRADLAQVAVGESPVFSVAGKRSSSSFSP